MKCPLTSFVLLSLGIAFSAFSQGRGDSTIVDILNENYPDKVSINQPEGLNERLLPPTSETNSGDEETKSASSHTQHIVKMVGYRIQVYADNNARTAKNAAIAKERAILARFPRIGTYISYKAPVWRLRVGNFRTHAEAQEMLNEIRRALPAYARECIIVRDRVNILQ